MNYTAQQGQPHFSIILQPRDPRENLLQLQLPSSRPIRKGTEWERLRIRHQGLLEEKYFAMVPQGSGEYSIVQGPWDIVQKEWWPQNYRQLKARAEVHLTHIPKPSVQWWTQDQMPRSPCKAGFIAPATGRAVSRQPSAVSPLRNYLTQTVTLMSDGGSRIKAKTKQGKYDGLYWLRAAVWQCGFPSVYPTSSLSLPQMLIQSILPNKHTACQLCLRYQSPGQPACFKPVF